MLEGSTVTSLSSGGGGTTALFQSAMMSAWVGSASAASRSTPVATEKRDGVMVPLPWS